MYTRESKCILEYNPLKGLNMKCDELASFECTEVACVLRLEPSHLLILLSFRSSYISLFLKIYILKIFI